MTLVFKIKDKFYMNEKCHNEEDLQAQMTPKFFALYLNQKSIKLKQLKFSKPGRFQKIASIRNLKILSTYFFKRKEV